MSPRDPWGNLTYANVWASGDSSWGSPPVEQMAPGDEMEIWRRLQFAEGGTTTETIRDVAFYYHPQQWESLIECKARFTVICAGWGWGKSIGLVQKILREAMLVPGEYWWVSPTFALAKIVQREYMAKIIPPEVIAGRYHETEHFYRLKNGSKIWLKSADDIGSLVAARVTGIVVDEATRCQEEAWTNALRGRLTGVDGTWAVFISSPLGHDWFYRLFERGQDPMDPEYRSFQYPTWGNPMISPEEIASAKRDLPPSWFDQNYGAMFISSGGGSFPGLDKVLRDLNPGPMPKRYYLTAADLANDQDFSVIITYDCLTKLPVALNRFRKMEWEGTIDAIHAQADEYPGIVWVDSTGVGKPIYEFLGKPWKGKRGLNVREYNISGNERKKDLIQQYQFGIEMGRIFVPQNGIHGPTYVREHQSFRPSLSRTGKIIWSAPAGWNDDCVMAGAIANFGLLSCPVSMDPGVLYPTGSSRAEQGRPRGE